MPKVELSQVASLHVFEHLKNCLEAIDNKIKSCGACADASSKLSDNSRAYFESQTEMYKECSNQVRKLIEALKHA